eukprot:COSAG01_NODE_70463_length_258_cov_0.981132_1_plen_25_part_10
MLHGAELPRSAEFSQQIHVAAKSRA